jgi:hypothetical protein
MNFLGGIKNVVLEVTKKKIRLRCTNWVSSVEKQLRYKLADPAIRGLFVQVCCDITVEMGVWPSRWNTTLGYSKGNNKKYW